MSNLKEKKSEPKSEAKENKLTIKQLIDNVAYVLKYAVKINRQIVVMVILAHVVCGLINALIDTMFLRQFILFLSDKTKDFTMLIVLILIGILVFGFGQSLEVCVENWARAKFQLTSGQIQADFIKKAANIDLICYDNKEYFDDFVIAVSQSEEMVTRGIISTAWILSNVVSILALGGLILTINPIIAIFPIAGFIINIITRFSITKAEYEFDLEQKRIMRKADYSKRVFYQPEYAKEIKLSGIEVPLQNQFEEAISELSKKAKHYGVRIAILSLINWVTVFTFLSFFCVPMYLGYLAIIKRSIGFGDVAAMNNAQSGVRNRLDAMNYGLVEFQKVGQFADRFRRFIEYKIEIEDWQGTKPVPEGYRELEIKDMTFRYEGATDATLRNVNMTVKPGEKIAIVGVNGAGKTTFVKLLMHLYDVTEGAICYGGNDIRDYNTKAYRDIFGAVFQDYQIYGASLGENVMMDETHPEDKERIVRALKLADFGRKLAKLDDGIDTQMTREFSEDGTMLSGGEAQKVAIARMFAKTGQLSIAILDEPSSALDPYAEYKLNKNMMESAKDATIIFISHRLSTTRDADRIYLFEHGEIIEQGSHNELMEQNGQYAMMFEKQAHYYQEEITEDIAV
jgi:ATP-binding cassette, subfamily B, bacterial